MIKTKQDLDAICIDFIKSIRKKDANGKKLPDETFGKILSHALAEDVLINLDLAWVIKLKFYGLTEWEETNK